MDHILPIEIQHVSPGVRASYGQLDPLGPLEVLSYEQCLLSSTNVDETW